VGLSRTAGALGGSNAAAKALTRTFGCLTLVAERTPFFPRRVRRSGVSPLDFTSRARARCLLCPGVVIHVTRIKGQHAAVNPDLIETIEETPDTVICFTSGEKMIVRESLQEIIDRVVAFRRALLAGQAATVSSASRPVTPSTHPPARASRPPPRFE
jgi:flagellar protein FlbD